jgi:hypothetical protein
MLLLTSLVEAAVVMDNRDPTPCCISTWFSVSSIHCVESDGLLEGPLR